jgi:hypothetical protein
VAVIASVPTVPAPVMTAETRPMATAAVKAAAMATAAVKAAAMAAAAERGRGFGAGERGDRLPAEAAAEATAAAMTAPGIRSGNGGEGRGERSSQQGRRYAHGEPPRGACGPAGSGGWLRARSHPDATPARHHDNAEAGEWLTALRESHARPSRPSAKACRAEGRRRRLTS